MFLVKDRRLGMDRYVFTHTDPRTEGYKGDVIEGVDLEYAMNIHHWPDGHPRPDPQLGRDPKNPKHYKVFKFPADLQAAGFEFVDFNTPFFASSWSDYRKNYYPRPEEYAKTMTEDEWFDFLEETDSAAKLRRKLPDASEPTAGSTRDQIAEWVATRHMRADGGVQQVWYLPTGSPAEEIRFLEVSDRYASESVKIEPIDFGLDVAGAQFKLMVADVTTDQLQQIKTEQTKLPQGWKIDNAKVWGRRK